MSEFNTGNLGTLTYTPPTPAELLRAIRPIVERDDGRWNQRNWVENMFGSTPGALLGDVRQYADKPIPDEPEDPDTPLCGTTGCTAGWAVMLGDDPRIKLLRDGYVSLPDGTQGSVRERATTLLGLSSSQASYLFDAYRSQEQVLDGIDRLIANPDDEIWHEPTISFTVQVLDENGTVVYRKDFDVDRDDDQHSQVESALNDAYHDH